MRNQHWKITSNRNATLLTSGIFSIHVSKIQESPLTASSLVSGNMCYHVNLDFLMMNESAIDYSLALLIKVQKGSFCQRNPSLDKALDIACSDEITSLQMMSMKADSGPTKEEIMP